MVVKILYQDREAMPGGSVPDWLARFVSEREFVTVDPADFPCMKMRRLEPQSVLRNPIVSTGSQIDADK